MAVEKPKPKQLLRPITTGADSATNQSQFLEITCNTLKAREKSRVHGAIGFGFASHWLKNWRESFKRITKRSNRNYIITFDSHLKTALYCELYNVNPSLTPHPHPRNSHAAEWGANSFDGWELNFRALDGWRLRAISFTTLELFPNRSQLWCSFMRKFVEKITTLDYLGTCT